MQIFSTSEFLNFRIDFFMKKYSDLIKTSSYSLIFIDIQRGIVSLGSLVNFFSQNVNGGNNLYCFISIILFQTKLTNLFLFQSKV